MQVPTVAPHTAKAGGFRMRDKPSLRRALRQARRALSPASRTAASARAVAAVAASGLLRPARVVALYAPLADEADPTGLEPFLRSHTIVYPRTTTDRGAPALAFGVSRLDELVPRGPWSIREPDPTFPPSDPDLVVVPGLGFTASGDRIGYGKGYYDRTLARLRADRPGVTAVGFGFRIQLVDALPVDVHDQPMDAVFTEDGLVAGARPR